MQSISEITTESEGNRSNVNFMNSELDVYELH